MVSGVYWFEIFLAVVTFALVAKIGYLLFKIHEHHQELQHETMREEYNHAIENFVHHPNDYKAKEEVYKKGDAYFKLKVPDYFEYPLPDFDTHVEYIDNRKIRKELVDKDIDNKLHHQKAA